MARPWNSSYECWPEVFLAMVALSAEKRRRIKRVANTSADRESLETSEMANLYPRETGLPMIVWVRPRDRARHDARIKVCMTHGNRMDTTNCAVVTIRLKPRVLTGKLDPRDFAAVARWIAQNRDALIGYWDGELSTVEFVTKMQRLTPSD